MTNPASDDYLGLDREQLRAIICDRDAEIERLTRQRDSFEHQVDLKNEGLREQRAEIERLRAELQGVRLGAEGMGWAPRSSFEPDDPNS